ncbi:hypothetical protein [Negadavirga shengliensis]|uniref:Lipoprotein n=1 Tax=Negadavirga shengliensis TaxID=1389218 RepID=A0ABV9T0B9_9BACT
MKKTRVFFLNGILLFSLFTCTIEKEVHSPGDFMDCSHEANIFSAKFNGDIVFNSFEPIKIGAFEHSFSLSGRKENHDYKITALYDTLFLGSFSCDFFKSISVEITRKQINTNHKLHFVDCSQDFKFEVEEIDFEKRVLCVRMAFTALQSSYVDYSVIEGGDILVVEDVFLSFK